MKVYALLVGVAAVLAGCYLIAWATRWPHSDVRDVVASAGGVMTVGVGLVAALAVLRSRRRTVWLLAVAGAVGATVLGLLVLGAVANGQAQACGDVLAACDSLLPGFAWLPG